MCTDGHINMRLISALEHGLWTHRGVRATVEHGRWDEGFGVLNSGGSTGAVGDRELRQAEVLGDAVGRSRGRKVGGLQSQVRQGEGEGSAAVVAVRRVHLPEVGVGDSVGVLVSSPVLRAVALEPHLQRRH